MAGSTTTVYIFSGSKVIAEYQNGAAPSSPTAEYVYAGGALLAKINSSGTFYYHQDHLSNRIVTNSSGTVTAQMGHFPFGESWYNATADKLFFTTYERDSESGNDYAMARYHISRLGRLSSPDPLNGSTSNPQSLNRYAYSLNDPANFADPSGLCPGGMAQQQPASSDQSGQSAGHGPSADSDPPPQGPPFTGCIGFTDQGGGADGPETGTLDGIDLNQIPSGLVGGGDSNDVFVGPPGSAGGFSPWIGEGGRYWDPTSSCYVDDDGMHCQYGYSNNFADTLHEVYGPSSWGIASPLGAMDGGGGGGSESGHLINPFAGLKDCVRSLYNVNTLLFVPAQPGSNGNFAGSYNGTTFHIETDVGSYSGAGLTIKASGPLIGGVRVALGDTIAGLTTAGNPYLNYIANDLSPAELYSSVWTHELGHALDLITTGKSSEGSGSGPEKLEDCVRNSIK